MDSREYKINSFIKNNPLIRKNIGRMSDYDYIYVTSDIHADFRKLVQLLLTLNLIRIPENIDIYTDDIYKSELITDTVWIAKRVLFVIVGDLIDGKRTGIKSVDYDPNGSFEFLIHAFLFNIRLYAKINMASNVVFTIGNHDHNNIIIRNDDFINKCAREKDILFFGGKDVRQYVLSYFYNVNPFYMYCLLNDDNTYNTIFVHGGFHYNGVNGPVPVDFKAIESIQKSIRNSSLIYTDLQDDLNNYLKIRKDINKIEDREEQKRLTKENDGNSLYKNLDTFFSYKDGIINTRFYLKDNICNHVFKNITVIVGHSQTYDRYNPNKIVTDMPIENKCGYSGCVLPKCVKDGKPNLIFVDTAVSASFINNITDIKDDRNRPFEILELKKLIRIEIPSGITYDL